MFNKLVAIGILLFAAVGAAGQTTTTDSNCSIYSTGANTASADCTSTTHTPPQPVPLDQDPSYKVGQQLGKGVGNLGTALIVNHKRAKMIKEYCATHSGEDYGQKDASGTFTKLGTCPGAIPVARRQQILIQSVRADATKTGIAKFAEVKGNTYVLHSERAGVVRFHSLITDPAFMTDMKQAELKTFVYTNDKDQTFTYDLVSGKEITTEAQAETQK